MFGFFRTVAMMDALEKCQQYHRKMYTGQELSEEQMRSLRQFSLFKSIANRYKDKGMSKWGGLAWFCGEFTAITLDRISQGEPIKPDVQELAEKLAFNITVIAVLAIHLGINSADTKAIGFAVEVADKLIDRHSIIN